MHTMISKFKQCNFKAFLVRVCPISKTATSSMEQSPPPSQPDLPLTQEDPFDFDTQVADPQWCLFVKSHQEFDESQMEQQFVVPDEAGHPSALQLDTHTSLIQQHCSYAQVSQLLSFDNNLTQLR